MKKLQFLFLILYAGLQFFSIAAAQDVESRFLPTNAKDVTGQHPDIIKIKKLMSDYVFALESKNRPFFDSLTTAHFRTETEFGRSWKEIRGYKNASMLILEELTLIVWRDRTLLRFTTVDRESSKKIFLPPGTWYEIKKEGDKWKVHNFLPNFSPDSGP